MTVRTEVGSAAAGPTESESQESGAALPRALSDSNRAVLYRVPLTRHGRPAPATAIQRLPLTGAWTQTAGVINANGIAVAPDDRSLLVVQSNTGFLFRVDPRTGEATRVSNLVR